MTASTEPDRSRRRLRPWWRATIAIALAAIGGGLWYGLGRDDPSGAGADQSMTARAQEVMPFDLNRTVHTFTKTADGGVQTVVVRDPADTSYLALIRSHLEQEAEQFRAGNYSDPARIHGMDMPGVRELEDGASRVQVAYAELPTGAQITYSSTEPALISALHAWFDRQTSDHAMPGMGR